jgi:hypothetical protein
LKTVQQTIADGIYDLTMNNHKDETNFHEKSTNSNGSMSNKKTLPIVTSTSKQKATKQISIRDIPMVRMARSMIIFDQLNRFDTILAGQRTSCEENI